MAAAEAAAEDRFRAGAASRDGITGKAVVVLVALTQLEGRVVTTGIVVVVKCLCCA